MEAILNQKSIHLEFYGLPGCGKSTVSEIVANRMELDGWKVVRASAETGDSVGVIKRRLAKVYRTIKVFGNNKNLLRIVKTIVKENGYTGVIKPIVQEINIAQKLYYYLRNEKAVYIWDQGMTQAAISLAIKGEKNSSENEERLLKLCPDCRQIHIFIDESKDTVLNRMNGRSTNNSRVEKEKDLSAKEKLLNAFSKECMFIKPDIVVGGNGKRPEELAQEIIDWCRML